MPARSPAPDTTPLARLPPHPRERALLWVGLLFLLLSVSDDLGRRFRPGAHIDFDLIVYYHAASALWAGVDPYDGAALARFAGQQLYGCYYPPLSVALFTPLTKLALVHAGELLLALKLLLLTLLLWAWTRVLGAWVPIVAAILWHYAVHIDLASGNVSVLEQALLWTGIAALLHGRGFMFACFVAAAAMFKLQLISMAVLALLVDPKRGVGWLASALALLAGYLLLNYWLFPELTRSFIAAALARSFTESGFHAPSLLAALEQLGAPRVVYGVAVSVILVSSTWVSWRARELPLLERVAFAVLALSLCWPRLKDYAFIVVIPSAAWLLARLSASPRRREQLAAIAVVLALVGLSAEIREIAAYDYRPLLLLVGLWLAGAAMLLRAKPT